jgi:dTDP-L-rhamnose 4-epimerase
MRCAYCGQLIEPLPTHEEKPLRPTSIYAISKMDQELMALSVGRAYALPTVALRYFNAYGPRQALSNPYTGIAAIFGGRLLNGRAPLIFEDGQQRRDFIHVGDLVRANLLAMRSDAANDQAINIGTGRPLSVLDVAAALTSLLGANVQPELTGKFREGDTRHCYGDIGLARRVLGFEPRVAFEEGMSELVAWMREQRPADAGEAALHELESRGLAR